MNKNIILIIAVIWFILLIGFNMVGLSAGWAMICATMLMAIVGVITYPLYKKYIGRNQDKYYW
jgi:glycerol-3-phosphate acyltransferase PlsY